MRWVLMLAVACAAGCSGGTSSSPPKQLNEKEIEAIVAKRVEAELKKREAKNNIHPPKAVPIPVEKPTYTFEESWSQAKQLSKQLNEEEPQKTEEAIKRLGTLEQGLASILARSARELRFMPADVEADLLKHELRDLVKRKRRELAFEDHPAGMKASCQLLWRESVEPSEYLKAAELWGIEDSVSTQDVVQSLTEKTYPQRTGAVRAIGRLPGGEAWLKNVRK